MTSSNYLGLFCIVNNIFRHIQLVEDTDATTTDAAAAVTSPGKQHKPVTYISVLAVLVCCVCMTRSE